MSQILTPEGEKMVKFCRLLRHSRGEFAGKPFELLDWQASFFDSLLGMKRDDGLRQYRRAFVGVSRKNGKTTLLSALGLFMLLMDNEPGAEVIVAAGDRAQAGILHTSAKQFIESCPSLARRCKIYRNSIVVPETQSSFLCVSADANLKHGLFPSCVLLDEIHVHPSSELADVLETGMGARKQPVTVYITTAGLKLGGWAHRLWERALKIQNGELSDPTFLPMVFCAEDSDDPFSMETVRKANPSLGATLNDDYFKGWIERAKTSVQDEVTFKTLHLGIWCQSANSWLRTGVYEKCMQPLRPTEGRTCYAGLDLSSTEDTTAFTVVWPDDDGTFDVFSHVFIPEERAAEKERTDKVPYRDWAREGWVTLTDGDVVDYDCVRDYVLNFAENNSMKAVAIDRYNATHLITQLKSEHIDVRPWGQGFTSMSSPTKETSTAILKEYIRAGDNKCLQWQVSNCTTKSNETGDIKLVKPDSRSPARIDAAVALVMAMGLAAADAAGDDDLELLVI